VIYLCSTPRAAADETAPSTARSIPQRSEGRCQQSTKILPALQTGVCCAAHRWRGLAQERRSARIGQPVSIEPIGFIGLGNMGAPMAANLLANGYPLMVHDRVPERAAALAAQGAMTAASPAAVAASCAVVFTMLPSSPDVEAVVQGPDGLAGGLGAGALWIDTSTIAPPVTRRLGAGLLARGVQVVDAPVSGGVPKAAAGTLALFVGGDAASVERAMPLLRAVGTDVTPVGDLGSGQIVKLVNNLVVGATLPVIMEGLVLGVKAGVPAETLLAALSKGTAASFCLSEWIGEYVMRGRFEGMFSVAYMLKDLGLAMETARDAKSPLLFGALAQQIYETARASGDEDKFWVAAARVIEQLGGAEVRRRDRASGGAAVAE
jgi:3-hydroxyisobutyrate dehydrogenase-like beta-hydroxyacid dehydrogenase